MKFNKKTFLMILLFGIIVGFLVKTRKYGNIVYAKKLAYQLSHYVQEHYEKSVVIFMVVCAVVAGFALPLAIPIGLLSGYLFGVIPGMVYTTIGSAVGSIVFFLLVRYLLPNKWREKYVLRFAHMNNQVGQQGVRFLLTMYYAALVPLFVMNMFAALSSITFGQFVAGTILGNIPINFAYSLAGSRLGLVHSVRDIFTRDIMLTLAFLILLVLAPVVYKKLKRK